MLLVVLALKITECDVRNDYIYPCTYVYFLYELLSINNNNSNINNRVLYLEIPK